LSLPVIGMRDIKTEIINTRKQVGDLVDWLILRHTPPEPYEPTIYIDLEGVNLCREDSLSILSLLIDTGIPTKASVLSMYIC
jgi:exonuclease 3'-5' domain-containing protein 1